MMSFFSLHSIKVRLILGLVVPLLIMVVITGEVVINRSVSQVKKDHSDYLLLTASTMAHNLDALMVSRGKVIQMLTKLPAIKNTRTPLGVKQDLLERVKANYSDITWLGMTDAEGNIIVAMDGLLVGKNVSQRAWFIQGRSGLYMGNVHDAFLLAKFMPKSKYDDSPLRVVDISAPIIDKEGHFIGVIAGHLGWDWAYKVRQSLIKQLADPSIDILVLKSDSTLLMGTETLSSHLVDLTHNQVYLEAKKKKSGVVEALWGDDQQPYLTAYASNDSKSVSGLKWIVIVRQGIADSYASAEALGFDIFILVVGVALFVIIFVGWMIQWQLSPLNKITLAASNILSGNHSVVITQDVNDDKNDVGILASTFNQLVRHLQNEIKKSKEYGQQLGFLDQVFTQSPLGIVITDKYNRIVQINSAYSEMTGYSKEWVLGKNPSILKSGVHDLGFYQKLWLSLLKNGRWQGEIWNKFANGKIVPVYMTLAVVRGQQDQVKGFIGIFADMTQQKKDEARLNYLARYDSLTGLLNRKFIYQEISDAIELSEQKCFSIIYIDMDYFKSVNDSLGHNVGDRVLTELSIQLNELFEDYKIGRVGGDEFVMVIPNVCDESFVVSIARRVVASIETPHITDEYQVQLGATLGIAVYPKDGKTPEELILAADMAMYAIKHKHTEEDAWNFYDESLKIEIKERAELIQTMKEALKSELFELYFQPQVISQTGRWIGFETLIRWYDSDRGFISPGVFIPLAEETGLIIEIDQWVCENALKQWGIWQSKFDLKGMVLSINLSGLALRNPNYFGKIKEMIIQNGINPETIKIEITETMLVEENPWVYDTLMQLRAFGCGLSMDDFGTGYANMNYIDRLPFSDLKIDISFIQKMLTHQTSCVIVKHAIELGASLGLMVIAEGVETQAEVDKLVELGCPKIQGYYFSHPLPAHELELQLCKGCFEV